MIFATREEWLLEAVVRIAPLFSARDYTVPENLNVSCGFPSRNALSDKKQAIGECWSDKASQGNQFEIFISPILSEPVRVLGVLVHELCHAIVGHDAGHGPRFRKCAEALGLEGKMTATTESDSLRATLAIISDELGPYPHHALQKLSNFRKPQTARQLKVICAECGYTVRTTKKWIEVGLPTCPCGKCMAADEPTEDEGE